MEQEQLLKIKKNLQDVPKGTLKVEHHFNGHTKPIYLQNRFRPGQREKEKWLPIRYFPVSSSL